MALFRIPSSPHGPRDGFSLLEMSVVVAIVSIVAVMGLEATSVYLGRTAYTSTRDKLVVLDAALRDYYRVTGRLPCPANRTDGESYSGGSTYGFENCTTPTSILAGVVQTIGVKTGGSGYSGPFSPSFSGGGGAGAAATNGATVSAGAVTGVTLSAAGSGYTTAPTVNLAPGGGAGAVAFAGTNSVYFGWVPVAELGLPVSAGIDAYGDRINYVVTQGLTNAYTFKGTTANVEVRSGRLKQPCAGTCSVLADPAATPPSGAAYVIFSNGADQRGGNTRAGATSMACLPAPTTSFDLAIDSQNCAAINGATLDTGSIGGTIPSNVFYDSRFNSGNAVEANKYDDIMLWRTKGQL